MLTLEPPYYEIRGVAVYRDHAVPTQFYYAAPSPKVSRVDEQPLFDLFAYRVALQHSPLAGTAIPDQLGAGFLTLGVDCALGRARQEALRRELASRTDLPPDQLALYPIPYHKGTVRVLALDQFAAPAEPSASAASSDPLSGRPRFVEQVLGSTTPALLGDLRAIFSLSLSQAGVTFLRQLYAEGAAPVGVVYELGYYGLRPAVEAHVTADLSRLYQHFGGGLSGQYSWFKADVEAGLDYLREHGDVQIELTSQATGAAAEKSKELALALFKDRVIQDLFRPTAPTTPAGLGATLDDLVPAAPVTLTLRAVRSDELKTVTYDFRERAPEERTHAPQGFLPLLLTPAEVQARLHQVDLHSDFFELLAVLVTGPAPEEFEALHLRQVEATLTYGAPTDAAPPESQTLLFRPAAAGDKTFAVPRRGRQSLGYTCALTYEFARAAAADVDSFRYALPPRPCTARALRINPYEDFGVLDVEVEPGRLHPDVREVDVALAYQAADGGFQATEHVRLTAGPASDDRRPRWQVRTRGRAVLPYTAAYTFVFQDGTTYATPPQPRTEPLLRVDSPFAQERRLLIRPNVPSPQITQLTVELEYADAARGYARRLLVSLAAPFASQSVSWPIVDASQQTVRYRVTAHEPGFISEGDWQETADPSIVVGAVGSRVATIQVRLIGPPLAEAGLDAVELKLALADPAASADGVQSLLLDGSQTSEDVKLALPPGAALRYRYQTVAFKQDGQVVQSAWKDMDSPLLVISTRAL